MYREKGAYGAEGLPDSIGDVLGEIVEKREEIPGVYYVVTQTNQFIGNGHYIVNKDSAAVSRAAKRCGKPLEDHPDFLWYSAVDMDRGRPVMEYEIYRYKALHGLPLPEGADVRATAVYGAELYPEYFGPYPVPVVTPWGHTTRYQVIANGVYWLESERYIQGMAVCGPLQEDLSQLALGLAEKAAASEQTPDCLFFSKQASCVPLFELFTENPNSLKLFCSIDQKSLMNAIYQYHPEYAVLYNQTEQAGGHAAFDLLAKALGMELEPREEPTGYTERMISLSEQAGTDFIEF